MKAGKIDVTSSYSVEVFQHAPHILHEQLASVFRSFLVHGSITLSILACSFMPLLKSKRKNPTKFDSYRAVAGASQLLKLFEYVIMDQCSGENSLALTPSNSATSRGQELTNIPGCYYLWLSTSSTGVPQHWDVFLMSPWAFLGFSSASCSVSVFWIESCHR